MKIRNSPQYAEWRRGVYERDGYRCFLCGDAAGGNLNAHHVVPLSSIMSARGVGTLQTALATPEIWDVGNGATLCETCHPKADEIGKVVGILNSYRGEKA